MAVLSSANPMVIDSHHHFWKYSAAEYEWISESMPVLRRDFLPEDLRREALAAGVDGVVSVQARQSTRETEWLLELAEGDAFIRGVVGWVPLASDAVERDLERFAHRPKLRSVRHVLQDEPDDGYVLREDFNRGISLLPRYKLKYDVLIFERHLPATIKMVDRHPDQVFILDHIAKPKIGKRELSPWAENLRELARRANVYCKLSGMATEADHRLWTPEQLAPYADVAIEAFGPRRLMFGSDWPVCLLACDYRRWKNIVERWAAPLSADERGRLFAGTAAEAYELERPGAAER